MVGAVVLVVGASLGEEGWKDEDAQELECNGGAVGDATGEAG